MAEEAPRACKVCGTTENMCTDRNECKKCNGNKRKARKAEVKATREEDAKPTGPPPEKCWICGESGVEFGVRNDTIILSWRSECTGCHNIPADQRPEKPKEVEEEVPKKEKKVKRKTADTNDPEERTKIYIENYDAKIMDVQDIKALVGDHRSYDIKELGGFIDGDGSLYRHSDGYICVTIVQCNPLPLFIIQNMYGGNVELVSITGESFSGRQQYRLVLSCNKCRQIIEDAAPYVIIEQSKFEAAIRYFDAYDKVDKISMEAELSIIDKLDKTSSLGSFDRLSHQYIAGLFDAEGEVQLAQKGKYFDPAIKITQAGDPQLLNAIVDYLGYGKLIDGDKRYGIYGQEVIIRFINEVGIYCIEKKKQIALLESWILKKSKGAIVSAGINEDKHMIYSIDKKILGVENKKYLDMFQPRKLTEAQQQSKDERYKKKSEQMTGAGNPNFGKERPEDHRLNMSRSIAIKKHSQRNISDGRILEIREYYKKAKTSNPKYTFDQLAERFEFSRKYVSDIVKGKVRTLVEIEDDANLEDALRKRIMKENGVELGSGRRKLNPGESLKVLKYLIEHPKLKSQITQLLENIQEIVPNLTISVMKNYQKGKIQVVESDFPVNDYTWEQYLAMKEKLAKIMNK